MDVYGKRGVVIRVLYLTVALLWFVLTLGSRIASKKGIVLCYHGILASQVDYFRRQMSFLSNRSRHGAGKPIRPKQDNKPLKACITFDDAFENLLENAVPILEEYQIPAVVFAVPGNFGRKPGWLIHREHPEASEKVMTEEQLVGLSKHPLIRIGSHTATHPDLTSIPALQVQTELADSRRRLEALLECPIQDLALPHGAYNQVVLAMAIKAGYKRIYTLDPKPTSLEHEEAIVGRFSMSPEVWKIEFMLTCVGAYAWLGPWRQCLHYVRDLHRRHKK